MQLYKMLFNAIFICVDLTLKITVLLYYCVEQQVGLNCTPGLGRYEAARSSLPLVK